MESRTVLPAIVLLCATATTGLASAQPPRNDGHPNGQKHRVLKIVQDYFVTRDKGWLKPEGQAQQTTEDMAAQPRRFAAEPAQIAAEVAEERGLQAEDVKTGIVGEPKDARQNKMGAYGRVGGATQ